MVRLDPVDVLGARAHPATGALARRHHLFLALQFLSSIYYGIYLALLVSIVVVCSLLVDFSRRRQLRTQLGALAMAGVVALILCIPYAGPYLRVRPTLGPRGVGEVARFSAEPSSYLAASPTNVLYGRITEPLGEQEKRLFPGTLALLLAGLAVVWRRSPGALIYIVGLVAALNSLSAPTA